jgi:hypothetical protein
MNAFLLLMARNRGMTRKAQLKLLAIGQQALDQDKQVLQQLEDLSPVTTLFHRDSTNKDFSHRA